MVVHVVQENRKKSFVGGYKHRLTGVEFHNASAQTIPKIRVPSSVDNFYRDTQTYTLRNRVQQTTNTTSTQMVYHEFEKIGCEIKCEVCSFTFNFVSSFLRPKMDVMYQMSQIKY